MRRCKIASTWSGSSGLKAGLTIRRGRAVLRITTGTKAEEGYRPALHQPFHGASGRWCFGVCSRACNSLTVMWPRLVQWSCSARH